MARRPPRSRTLRDLRAEAEAAEARGLTTPPKPRSAGAPEPERRRPLSQPRMRVVWAVCDMGGRTVASFPYAEKAAAEEHAAALKARGKGAHFVRSVKEPMEPA